MQLFELVALLTLNSQAYEAGMEKAQQSAQGFSGGMQKIGKIASRAFAGAVGAIGLFTKESISTGQQFDSAMSQVAATMGKSADEIQNLRDFAKEMGRTTAFTAAQAADGLNVLAMAGYSAEKSIETLPGILSLASAGGIDIAQAADYATGILAGFGDSSLTAGTVANRLAMIAKSAKGDVASFGEGLSTVAGMARTTGQSMEDMTVALGILGNNNYSASEAGNALSRTLRNLYQPSDSAKKMLDKLGVSAYDANGSTKPLQQVLLELNGALDGLDDQSKNAVLSKIFDAATLKSVPALMNNAGQAWDELSAKIASADAEQTAGAMAEQQLNNLSGAMTIFQSAVDGAKIAISEKLTPTLIDFVKVGTTAVSDLTSAFESGGIDGLMDKLGEVFGNIAQEVIKQVPTIVKAGVGLLMGIGKGLISAFPTLMTAVKDVISMATTEGFRILMDLLNNASGFTESAATAIKSFASGLAERIPDLAHTMLLLVNWIVRTLSENGTVLFDAGIELLRSVMNGIMSTGSDLAKIVPQLIENVLGAFYENYPKIFELGAELLHNLAEGVVTGIPLLLETVLPMMAEYSSSLLETSKTIVDAGLELLLALVQGLMDGLPTLIEYVPIIISNIASIINENMPKILATGVQILWMLITGIVSAIPSLISNIGNIMLMAVNVIQAINWLGIGTMLLENIVSGIVNVGTSLPNTLKNLAESAWNMVKNHDWLGLGKAIINGIVNGIKSLGSAIGNALSGIASGAVNGLKNLLGIHSPSRLFSDEIGKFIPEGIAVGITANADSVYDTMQALSDGTVEAYNPQIEDLGVNGSPYGMSGVLEEIRSLKEAMTNMQIVLDSGTLVGELTPAFDTSLGNRAVYSNRGN